MDKYFSFGEIYINSNKLSNFCFLSVRNKYFKVILGLNVIHISNNLVNILCDYKEGKLPTIDGITELIDNEKILYDRLVILGKLRRTLNNTIENSIIMLKNRLEKYNNTYEKNNTNNPFDYIIDKKRELLDILYPLYNFGAIRRKEIKEHILNS